MRNILVTNYKGLDDVMILNTTLTEEEVSKSIPEWERDEVYEVDESQRRYYAYDPLYADEEFDNAVRNKLNN